VWVIEKLRIGWVRQRSRGEDWSGWKARTGSVKTQFANAKWYQAVKKEEGEAEFVGRGKQEGPLILAFV
jgi:hypothetical protein